VTLTAGQLLTPLEKPPITEGQLKEYAEASLDHNPIHLDPQFAKEAGFPSVIAHGMLSMAFLADYLRSHFPASRYDLARMKTRFRKVTFPGDQLTCEGKVKEVLPDGTAVVAVSTRNAKGEITADGEATVRPR
jgi:acyl dehydratase